MSAHRVLLYFGAGRPDVIATLPLTANTNVVTGPVTQLLAAKLRHPVTLLAVGPEGGAALARWVDAHGLDRVTGVGLVSVTAPWAERGWCESCPGTPEAARVGEQTTCAACDGSGRRLPLGPLEPLRAVAEEARRDDWKRRIRPLHLVIACAPDDGVCAGCLRGSGLRHVDGGAVGLGHAVTCWDCSGSGKALSSADVAQELIPSATGGAAVIEYPTRAELYEHGLRAVVERLIA